MKRLIRISIIILILGIIGYFACNWHKGSLESARKQEREKWQEMTGNLEYKIAGLQEELTLLKGARVPGEKLIEVFGEESTEVFPEEEQISLEKIERQIAAFFSYLNKQEYVTAYKLEGGTYLEFQQAVQKLSSNSPIVTGEAASLYRLLRNLAHFYRVLGKKRVHLIKGILKNESEIIESAMKTFYLWFTLGNGSREKIKGRPSIEVLYEYSGYFLNTLAGRSYLLRRDSKVRILTTYYCVLILDRANDEKLNSHGINVRPHIKSLFNDISNQIGLIHQKQYLSKLEDLKEKYLL
jgi:hypothetical protein